jgi:hypothetical protein
MEKKNKIRIKKISLNHLIPRIIEAYHLMGADFIDMVVTLHPDKPAKIKIEILDEYFSGEPQEENLEDEPEKPTKIDDYESLI